MSTFRKQYRELSADEVRTIDAIKSTAEVLEELYQLAAGLSSTEVITHRGEQTRAVALAMTALEESVMWAVKGITR